MKKKSEPEDKFLKTFQVTISQGEGRNRRVKKEGVCTFCLPVGMTEDGGVGILWGILGVDGKSVFECSMDVFVCVEVLSERPIEPNGILLSVVEPL